MPFRTRPILRQEDDTSSRDKELQSLYRDAQGNFRDMSRFEHRKKRRSRTFLLIFVVFLTFFVGAVAGSFFFFRSQDRFTGEGVKVVITAPEQITSGDEIRYRIDYTNNEPMVLGNVELTVRYPSGFTVKEAHPSATSQSGTSGGTWIIGTLPRGRSGKVELVGKLAGTINTQANLQALLTYKPANFNAEFQEIGSATTTIAGSILSLVIDGGERVLPDTETAYTITYEHTASEALEQVEVRVKLPDDFTVLSTKPERLGVSSQWDLQKIEPKKKGTITIRGKYAKEATGERKIIAMIGFGKGDAFSLQKEDAFVTNVVKGDLLVSLTVNGSSGGSPVQFGDLLPYVVTIKNNSDTPMENVTARLFIASPVIDWATVEDIAKGVRDGSTITWSRQMIRDLRLLDPGEELTIRASVRLKRTKEGLNLEDLAIESRAEVTVGKAGKLPSPLVVNSNTIVQQVNTDIAFDTTARYFAADGTKVGDGPLPPRVLQTTTYRVEWTLTNTLHELLSIKVAAPIPLDAAFGAVGRVTQGTLLYNPDTREVSWTLQRLPTTVTKATAEFSIVVTPTQEAVGKTMPLVGATVLSARDKVTTGLLQIQRPVLSTALDDDEFGRGKGVVTE